MNNPVVAVPELLTKLVSFAGILTNTSQLTFRSTFSLGEVESSLSKTLAQEKSSTRQQEFKFFEALMYREGRERSASPAKLTQSCNYPANRNKVPWKTDTRLLEC